MLDGKSLECKDIIVVFFKGVVSCFPDFAISSVNCTIIYTQYVVKEKDRSHKCTKPSQVIEYCWSGRIRLYRSVDFAFKG